MTDYSELVERMRAYPANKLCIQIANALEAQAKEIAEFRAALTDCADALEAWVDDIYAKGSVPAGYGAKYERDVAVVQAARAALKGEQK